MKQNQQVRLVLFTFLLIFSLLSTNIFAQNNSAIQKFKKANYLERNSISKFMIDPAVENNSINTKNFSFPGLFKTKRLEGTEPAIDSIVILSYDTSYQWIKYSYDYDDYGYIKEYLGEYTDEGVKGYFGDYHFEHRPDGKLLSSLNLNWKDGVWVKTYKTTYIYDPAGNNIIIMFEKWDTTLTAWVNQSKDEYAYNANGNMILSVTSTWNGSAWLNYSKTEWGYDANNNETSQTKYFWSSGVWEERSKQELTYDGNYNKTSEIHYNWLGGVWVNSYKRNYSYNAHNNMISQNEFNWNSSTNQWDNRYWHLYNYNADGNKTFENNKKWDSGTSSWVDNTRVNTTYNTTGKILVRLIETWDGSNWQGTYQDQYTYDTSDHMLSYIYSYDWNGNGWNKGDKYDFTYDYDGLCERGIHSSWLTNHWVSDDSYLFLPELPNGNKKNWQLFSFCANGYEIKPYYRSITGVKDNNKLTPNSFSLSQNYPNPFNPSTTIKYSIPPVETQNFASVQLNIYNVLGEKVTTLVNKEQAPGSYEVNFNASNLSSGIYFYQLKAGSNIQIKKMILLK